MVDVMFKDQTSIDQLLASVKVFNPNASAIQRDIPQVRFHVNIGDGEREIALSLHGVFLEEYQAQSELAGVVESLGPTLHSPQPGRPVYNIPVAPTIAPQMAENSFIINTDYRYSSPPDEYAKRGLQILENGGIKIAQISNKDAVINWSESIDLSGGRPIPPNPARMLR